MKPTPDDCPWCGSKRVELESDFYDRPFAFVECHECWGRGPTCQEVETAVAAWNAITIRDESAIRAAVCDEI